MPAHAILQRVGEAGYVGGQEDIIIDVAFQLQEEQLQADELRAVAVPAGVCLAAYFTHLGSVFLPGAG